MIESEFWGFGDDWIVIGLILFAITFLAGALFFGPESGRLGKLAETEGPTSPVVQARMQRLIALSRADLMLLFLLIFDMAVKPVVGRPLALGRDRRVRSARRDPGETRAESAARGAAAEPAREPV